MLLENILFAIQRPVAPSYSGELPKNLLDELVASQSHGNVWLQLGQFYMQEDVDADYERFKNHKFAN